MYNLSKFSNCLHFASFALPFSPCNVLCIYVYIHTHNIYIYVYIVHINTYFLEKIIDITTFYPSILVCIF